MTRHFVELAARVRRAAADLDRHATPSRDGPYLRLAALIDGATLAERVDVAHAIYLHGNAKLRSSRTFDLCLEQGGGRAVCGELTRRALQDPALHIAIAEDFGGAFPKHWLHGAPVTEQAASPGVPEAGLCRC